MNGTRSASFVTWDAADKIDCSHILRDKQQVNKGRDKAQSMRDTSDNKKKLIRELNTLRCHSLLSHKRFGHSPSSVCRNMHIPAHYRRAMPETFVP